MPPRKASLIAAVAAVRRLFCRPAPPSGGAAAPASPASRLRRRRLACYRCGREVDAPGPATWTVCSGCRQRIEIVPYTVGNEVHAAIRTAGDVVVTEAGRLTGGEITATRIVLHGEIADGEARAGRVLELGPTARFKESALRFRDLLVQAASFFRFAEKIGCRRVELFGRLEAGIDASDGVTIHNGGALCGALETPSLVVEEGGGLVGSVRVIPPGCEAGAPAPSSSAA